MKDEIAGRLKHIEWLKTELVSCAGDILKYLQGTADIDKAYLTEALADEIVVCYLLARRAQIEPETINICITKKLYAGISQGHILEKEYADLSAIKNTIAL